MADTIITNTPDRSDSATGGIIALVLVVALLLGGILLYRNGAFTNGPTPATTEDTNINVTVPNPLPSPDTDGEAGVQPKP